MTSSKENDPTTHLDTGDGPAEPQATHYDVFISHASEDKDAVARPLAVHLSERGLKVWLDEFELTLGDSLRRNIDKGLSNSEFGSVILSQAFFNKEWPNKELDGLVAREDGSNKVILPVWHNVNSNEIRKFSPTLAGKIGVSTANGIDKVADAIVEAVLKQQNGRSNNEPNRFVGTPNLLPELRTRLISAKSGDEIIRIKYDLDKHLSVFPYDTEAKLLMDKVNIAIDYYINKEYSITASSGSDAMIVKAPANGIGCLFVVIVTIIVIFLSYFLF